MCRPNSATEYGQQMKPYSAIKTPVPIKNSYYYGDSSSFGVMPRYVIQFILLHIASVYAYYHLFSMRHEPTFYKTWFYAIVLHYFGIEFGVALGAHRLWSHRSYKVHLPARIFIGLCNTLTGQYAAYRWAWLHRVHHKWSDTDADPHTTKRGFFYVHVGWMIRKPHPHHIAKTKTVDVTDLINDPVIYYQHKYYWPLFLALQSVVVAAPVLCWNETWFNSFTVAFVVRYFITLHDACIVNSAAHMFGARPYNAAIRASENLLVSIGISEGHHNYHHQYPYDYKSSEHGHGLNLGRLLIEFLEMIGQAYDLKKVSDEVIQADKKKALANKFEQCQFDKILSFT